MRYEFDKQEDDSLPIMGVDVYLKSKDVDSYDPVLLIETSDDALTINNGYYTYKHNLCDVEKVVLYKRSPVYDVVIDDMWYNDTHHEVIWFGDVK